MSHCAGAHPACLMMKAGDLVRLHNSPVEELNGAWGVLGDTHEGMWQVRLQLMNQHLWVCASCLQTMGMAMCEDGLCTEHGHKRDSMWGVEPDFTWPVHKRVRRT